MDIFSDEDILWLNKINFDLNLNLKYELEICIRIYDKNIYEKILNDFKKISKEFNLKYNKKIIHDDIIYDKNYKIIKRNEDKFVNCYTKKTLIWKYLDNIPGIIYLNTEQDYNLNMFNENKKEKIEKNQKRHSFKNEEICFDFTEIDNDKYSIELEILDSRKYSVNKIQRIIIENINILLSVIPENIIINYKISKYKKYIKQPIPLKDVSEIKYKYCVTSKFDGTRAQLYINNKNKCFILINNFQDIINIDYIPKTDISNTIIDGELIDDKIFYAFDLIMYKNNILNDYCLFERLNILKYDIIFENTIKLLYEIKKYYFDNIYEDSKKIIKKRYNYIYNNKKYDIPTDGLIFTDVKNSYINSITFKWKKNITFDFKIYKIYVTEKKEEWNLKCYTKDNNYIDFTVENINKTVLSKRIAKKYENGDIVEFEFNKSKRMFIPIRQRKDKLLPNFIDIANDNWNCILNPIIFN